MRTLAFRIAYDGKPFHGFQKQKDPALPTVQGLLEHIVSDVLAERVEVVCAGRTDTGVHATGQVVHCVTQSTRPLEVVSRAVTRLAHGRLAVRAAWEAPPWFHARHRASCRVYQYHILNGPEPSPTLAARTWHVRRPLDLRAIQAEARDLQGRRDFKAFQAGAQVDHYFRTIKRVSAVTLPTETRHGTDRSYLRREVAEAPLICVEFEADAFLPHMVRMLVGTLVDVGSGLRRPGTVRAVLRSRDPGHSSAAAPANGLCLVDVAYPAHCLAPH